jgi:glycosyltransferase involved in cell wall biosynthesis
MIQNESFIVFGEDFARHPHALEHLLRPLFSMNRFFWVETIGLRSPKFTFYDFSRILEKIKGWLNLSNPRDQKIIPPSVTVIRPLMIPYNQFSIIRRFNCWNVLRKVRYQLSLHNIQNPISISSVPNACDFIGSFAESLKVYYCVDEFSLWPGLDLLFVQSMEKKLMKKVDLILATSDSLTETKTLKGSITPLITHGVEFEHFNIGSQENFHSPLRLCYFGLFDERTDQNLLIDIATTVSECEIHIIGKIVCDVNRLKSFDNIKFHGSVSYRQLPFTISSMDIFILPYLRNQLTNNINPLKMKEYLATGRPVVSMDLPEVVKLGDFILIANNSRTFIDHILALKNRTKVWNSLKVLEYIKNNETWEIKAMLFSKITTENMVLNSRKLEITK